MRETTADEGKYRAETREEEAHDEKVARVVGGIKYFVAFTVSALVQPLERVAALAFQAPPTIHSLTEVVDGLCPCFATLTAVSFACVLRKFA